MSPKGREIRVVDTYKHLGAFLASSPLDPGPDVTQRVSTTMQLYAPIAVSIFGNPAFKISERIALAKSLLFSRLFLGVHTWSRLTLWALRRLSIPYMRILRRIGGMCRGGPVCWSDEQVRLALGMPHVERIISQARLCYLGQLLRSRAHALKTLLGNSSLNLPWTNMVRDDLNCFYKDCFSKVGSLGAPCDNPERWSEFILRYPRQWKLLVRSWSQAKWSQDQSRKKAKDKNSFGGFFKCTVCSYAADSQRALDMHSRVAHGKRCEIRRWAADSGICVVCQTTFSTRLRLIGHLTESRIRAGRQPCRQELHLYPQLPDEEIARLDAIDREARLKARRQGHTQPLSQAQCVRKRPPAEAPLRAPSPKRRRLCFKQPCLTLPPPQKRRKR